MENLFNKMFPLKCINCGEMGEIICDNCLYDCDLLTTQFCIVCNKPSFYGFTHKECLEKNRYAPRQIISIYKYADTIRSCIKTSKYGSKQFITLKKITYEGIRILNEWGFEFKDFICLPVPSSKGKYIKRGFNQSEIITEIFCKKLNLKMENSILNREKETDAQFTLGKKDRFKNVQNAFKVCKDIKGKNIVLVDDIVTSGATLLEISKVLYENGANRVKCFTLSKKFKDR